MLGNLAFLAAVLFVAHFAFGWQQQRGRSTMFAVGTVLIGFGVLLVLVFAVLYDTTVAIDPELGTRSKRVYNVGLQTNRLIGVFVGLGSVGAGIALTIAGQKRTGTNPPPS